MYISSLVMQNIRTFDYSTIRFVHPDLAFRTLGSSDPEHQKLLPKPKLPNVNLLLGDNASGKTTVLQAISLAALGPAAREAKLPHRRMVRLYPVGESATKHRHADSAFILAKFYRHEPETMASDPSDPDLEDELFESMQEFERRGELESMEWAGIDSGSWAMAYESTNSAFFCAAYGSNRRVESVDYPELGMRDKVEFARAQRVLSVFQDGYPLYRLANWLPRVRKANASRYEELSELLRRLTGPGHFQFTGLLHDREYDFERSGTSIPFPASLSDGYRGFIGWVGDLLYHMNYASQNERSLADLSGIVMVDEIDLLLHPKWQMKVIKTIAKALPRIQFIFTSHSPLVASSLEWMNINLLKINEKTNRTVVKRLKESIHGLDADQMLLTEFFGLKTTRAAGKVSELSRLQRKARHGDTEAARQIILAMAKGNEDSE